ncbi:MAG: L,D-transpeptidase family protein [Anaerolineales bacterium]|nr:L,D-transpeptidase family protein [Anaerolineales bacterium]
MIDSPYHQAQIALRTGQRPRALVLAREAVRQDPNDHRAWLLLAGLTNDPAKSLEYVERAEMLQPHDPTVRQARTWAERRLPASLPRKSAARSSRKKWGNTAVFFLAALLIFLALVAGGLFVWATLPSGNAVAVLQTAVPQAVPPTAIIPNTPAAELTPGAPGGAPHSLAKAVAPADQNDAPRPVWTVTPTPTITPTPTPTPVPTFLSPQNQQLGVRPFGVGPDERWVDVNLTTQTLNAYEGNNVVYTALVSSGIPAYPTVTGMFRIYLRFESQTMNGYLLGYDYYLEGVPYVMYFYEDYALHGAYWHENFGYPMSHGCVNLDEPDAAWLYAWTTYGTVVNVHY